MNNNYEYSIWQLPVNNKKCFRPVDYENVFLGDYVHVYVMSFEEEKDLEEIYTLLNDEDIIPKDYYARSLSVSDLITVRHDNKIEHYVVDLQGFKKVYIGRTKID